MNTKKENIFRILTYFTLSLSLVLTTTNMIFTILNSNTIMGNLFGIIITIILAIVSISIRIMNILFSILLTIYSILGILLGINLPKDLVIDFTGMDIKEVVSWAEERNILIEQTFKNSETIEKYKVISQDIKQGTNTKKIDIIKVVVSDGFAQDVITEVNSMIGWNLDDVIRFIDENHLTNVTILF